MEKLKVGQSFEVVEVLDYGFADTTLFKIGGFTVARTNKGDVYQTLSNGSNSNGYEDVYGLYMYVGSEIKPIGKLTITSIKKGGSHLSKINAKAIELYNTYRDKAPVLEANIKSKRRAMLHCDYKVEKAIKRADFIEAVFYQEVKQELLNLK